jgi:methionyl-tRNA formyltransferase
MADRLKVVFLGTPEFATPVLEALHRETDVVLVVSQPDRPVGRGCRICKPPAKVTAERCGIDVIQPDIVKGKRFSKRMAELGPDFIVTAAFGRILGPSLFEVPKKACLNVHASLLPRYRGAAPANWAVLNADQETGVSIMQMERELDAGPVYYQVKTEIGPRETAGELLRRLADLGADALVHTIRNFEDLTPTLTTRRPGRPC